MQDAIKEILLKFRKVAENCNSEDLDFNLCNGYILQSTRTFIEAYANEENIIILTKRQDTPVVTTWAGNNPVILFSNLIKNLKGKKLIVKNVNEKMKLLLADIGFREYGEGEFWDIASKYDDNTYPELILNTQNLVDLEGSGFQSLREDLNRFNKDYKIQVEEFIHFDFSQIEDLFNSWVMSMSSRNGWTEKQLIESTKILFTDDYGVKNYLIRDSLNNKIIGWMNFSECSKECLGFNVLVNDFEYYNLYRIMMLKGCKIANDLGYKYLNIQGSEDEGQYLSKLRMKPEFQTKKLHMMYESF